MSKLDNLLEKVPRLISSKFSIVIYVFLFFYLVIFALCCGLLPFMKHLIPSDNVQLILGNYTNVLSALGASIAAGSGVVIHNKITNLHDKHKKLQDTIDHLHEKIDKLSVNHTI